MPTIVRFTWLLIPWLKTLFLQKRGLRAVFMYAQIKLWQNVVGVLHYSVCNCRWNESMEQWAERELSCDEPKGACLNPSRKPFPKHPARFQGASCSSWEQIRISALSKNFIALNLRVGWDTPKESLQELAEELDCLVRLAYPRAPEEMKDLQYIDKGTIHWHYPGWRWSRP